MSVLPTSLPFSAIRSHSRVPRRKPLSGGAVPLVLGLWLFCISTLYGLVGVNVNVTTSPSLSTAFTWSGSRNIVFERRILGETSVASWAEVGRVTNATFFTDSTPGLTLGQSYEYRLIVTSASPVENVLVTASFDAVLEDERGAVLLVVDNALKDQLAGDITRYEMDLVGDGWQVVRLDFDSHGTATPPDLKAAIQAAVMANPAINSLFLFGNVPVPFSGNIAPDGHAARPHATDTYYADLDGTWTDVGTSGANVPGDGRFDQASYPTTLELATGRVVFDTLDFVRKRGPDMSRDYLHKNHAWRQGQRTVAYRASLDTFYHGPWYNWSAPMFGTANTSGSFNGTRTLPSLIATARGGTYALIHNLNDVKAIFTSNFQSYRQEWYKSDNANMAALGLPDWALTACWGGRPGIYLHQIAAGQTMGQAFLGSQNDLRLTSGNRSYYAATVDSVSYGFAESYFGPGVYINLQGDPTLRAHPVLPVKGLSAVKSGDEVALSWTPSLAAGLQGYHVYRSTERLGTYTRLTPDPILDAAFTDIAAPAGLDTYYQVRAIAKTAHPTGSYFNQSQGAFALVKANGTANQAPTAAEGTVRAKRNTPTPFQFPGTDADGDTLTPIILNNPQNGFLRWWNGRPFYISDTNYVGSDTITFAMSDGVAVSEPATITVNVDEVGENVLLAWDFTGTSAPGSTWNVPGVLPSSVTWSNAGGLSNSFPNIDQFSFRFLETVKGRYVPFTITPQAGRKVSVEEVRIALNGTSDAVFTLELLASTDNFATSVHLPFAPGDQLVGNGIQRHNNGIIYDADASGQASLQDVEGPVQFRLYIWRTGGNSNTTISLGKISNTEGQPEVVEDFVITGQVSKIDGTPNQAPVSVADSYSTYQDTPLVVAAPGVLSNDSDADADGLMAFVVTPPAQGTVSLATDGSFTYTPTAAYAGPDSFTYRIWDGGEFSAPVTVSLDVKVPTALNNWRQQWFSTMEGDGNSANTATPGNDGIPNLVKFATGDGTVDPRLPGILPLTAGMSAEGDVFEVTYTLNKSAAAAGVTLALTWSDTLQPGPWSDAGVNVTDTDDEGATWRITATVPLSSEGERFIRLEAEEAPAP